MNILIQNGRVIDPSQGIDRVMNVAVAGGKIAALGAGPAEHPVAGVSHFDEVIDATGRIVSPGLIDLNAQLQEPGWEEDETIATGTAAAVAGGFTSIACVPNTDPPIDTQAGVAFVRDQAKLAANCNVFVLACVSKGREGEQLAEIGSLVHAGAAGFCDALRPVQSAELLRRALQYCRMFDKPILNHPEATSLTDGGVMHDGLVSTILGLKGIPVEAEDIMTARDIRLAEATGGRLHLQLISTAGSVEVIRRAKKRGVPVTAEVCPHNFSLTDEVMRSFDSNFKINPPFRSQEHIDACIEGLKDGTLDVIASGHAPRALEKTMRELDVAPFGAVALETTLALTITHLIEPGHLTWPEALARLTCHPAAALGIAKGTLRPGADADITVIHPGQKWTVTPGNYASKGRNCPHAGRELTGRAEMVVVQGEVHRVA